MIKTKKIVEIYSDGSGNSLDSDGGWGYVLVVDGTKISEGSGFLKSATNNIAELNAAIQGLQEVGRYKSMCGYSHDDCIVTLISDSQLVLNYAKNTWKCKKEHLWSYNQALQSLYNCQQASGKWVKGHSGNEWNERCDVLAGQARKKGRLKQSKYKLATTLIKLNIVTDPAWVIQAAQ